MTHKNTNTSVLKQYSSHALPGNDMFLFLVFMIVWNSKLPQLHNKYCECNYFIINFPKAIYATTGLIKSYKYKYLECHIHYHNLLNIPHCVCFYFHTNGYMDRSIMLGSSIDPAQIMIWRNSNKQLFLLCKY